MAKDFSSVTRRLSDVIKDAGDREPVAKAPKANAESLRAQIVALEKGAMQQNFSAVEEQRPEITSVTADGDDIVVIGREQGRIRATSAGYDVRFVQRFKFIDGKLASLQIIAANSV